MKNLKFLLIVFALIAFGHGSWAQTHVSTESQLRTAIQVNNADIVLDNDITLTDMLTIEPDKTVTINMYSHTLDRGLKNASEGISRGQVFAVAGTLNLNSGVITGAFGTYGGSYVASGATLNLNGVSIRDCKSKNGGTITIADGGQLKCDNAVTAKIKKTVEASTADDPHTPEDEAVNKWYLIASPVNTQHFVDVTNLRDYTHNIYRYNEQTIY